MIYPRVTHVDVDGPVSREMARAAGATVTDHLGRECADVLDALGIREAIAAQPGIATPMRHEHIRYRGGRLRGVKL